MEERAIIKFTDGTEIEAEVNGDNYIVAVEPEFPNDLSEVIIEKDGVEETIRNAFVQPTASVDGRFWFIFSVPSNYDVLESQVLYTALMTDTLLEEE